MKASLIEDYRKICDEDHSNYNLLVEDDFTENVKRGIGTKYSLKERHWYQIFPQSIYIWKEDQNIIRNFFKKFSSKLLKYEESQTREKSLLTEPLSQDFCTREHQIAARNAFFYLLYLSTELKYNLKIYIRVHLIWVWRGVILPPVCFSYNK